MYMKKIKCSFSKNNLHITKFVSYFARLNFQIYPSKNGSIINTMRNETLEMEEKFAHFFKFIPKN